MSFIKNFSLLIIFLLVSTSIVLSQKGLEGEYYIQSALGNKYLDVKNGISAPGTPLQIWEFNGTNAQKFQVIWAEPGFYYLKSKLGHYVYAEDDIPKLKSRVKIGKRTNADNFKWKLYELSNGYIIFMNKRALNMDVQWGVAKNGTPIWMWESSGTGAQRWKLKSTTASNPNLISLTLPSPKTPAPAKINKGLWTTVFNAALNKVRIRINNFTPQDFKYSADNTYRWVKPNDSELVIPHDKSPYRKTFNIEPFRVEPMTIYIHDMNLSNARTSHENGKVKITFKFEEQGMEIRTNCIDNFGCGGIGNPNFNFEDPVIEVLFKPIVKNGKITYKQAEVRFSGHLSHVGVNIGVSLLEAIAGLMNFDIDGELSKKGSKILEDYLNDPDIIRVITDKINDSINHSSLSHFNLPPQIGNVQIDNQGNLLIYER